MREIVVLVFNNVVGVEKNANANIWYKG